MNINLELISEDGIPYQKYLDGLKDSETASRYNRNLHLFLIEIPDEIYEKTLQGHPDPTDESRAEYFVKFCRKYPQMGFNIIVEYVKIQKSRAELDEISPNTVPNYQKPIKILLDQNNIALLWKKIYNMYPREVKSKDRAYTTKEIQWMLEICPLLVDKVIITMHASAGFRLESWDFFTWEDIVFFKDTDSSLIKGGALRVYHGDPEEYWTHLTPEACNYLLLYKERWLQKWGHYPKEADPLLFGEKFVTFKALKQKGVRKRIEAVVRGIGLRKAFIPGTKRYPVKLVHGFRKFCNTMMRRAKVEFADKEKIMGHKIGLESNYERYVESDFELFSEYQKAIPFLSISDVAIKEVELEKERAEKNNLKKKIIENKKLSDDLKKEKEERLASEMEMKEAFAEFRKEKLANFAHQNIQS